MCKLNTSQKWKGKNKEKKKRFIQKYISLIDHLGSVKTLDSPTIHTGSQRNLPGMVSFPRELAGQ